MRGLRIRGISDEHVEWAVVDRLKAMLDEPPKAKFNVTQSFALFNSILLWTKNRAWVGARGWSDPIGLTPRIMRCGMHEKR